MPPEQNGTTPVSDEDIQKLNDFNEATLRASMNLDSLGSITSKAGQVFSTLSTNLSNVVGNLKDVNNVTGETATKFGLVTTAVIGARESFASLGDTKLLTTFTSQADDLFKTLTTKGTALNLVNEARQKTLSMLSSAGVVGKDLAAAASMSSEQLADYAKNVLTGADNTYKFQNAMIQAAARAGNLDAIYKGAGNTLKGFGNDLANSSVALDQQFQIIQNTMRATGIIDPDVVSKYGMAIGKLPGGFEAMSKSMTLGGKSTNLLTAAIQYSVGAGRDQEEVIGDMNKAIMQYGVSVDKSLQFTARMTEVSSTLGIPIESVRNALNNSADAFRMFAVGGESAFQITTQMTDAMNDYVGSLMSVGVPQQNALDMWQEMSGTIGSMTTAQKAFLSSQTGGSGGLMGAFQIDKMMKEGDFKGVYDKVQKEIRSQLGSIVTVDEASQSEQAAEQMQRQIQILRGGPLGHLAKTDVEAERLLESLKSGKAPTTLEGPEAALKASVDKGNKFEELSYTKLDQIAINTAGLRMAAGLANANTITNSMAARSFMPSDARATQQQEELRTFKATTPRAPSLAVQALNTAGEIYSTLPNDIQETASSLKNSLFPSAVDSGQLSTYTSPGQQIGATARKAQAQSNIPAPGLPGATADTGMLGMGANRTNAPIPVVLTGDNQFTITLNCPNCGTKYEQTAYGRVNNPAGR